MNYSLGGTCPPWNIVFLFLFLFFLPSSEAQFSVNFYVALGSIELYETLLRRTDEGFENFGTD